MESNLSEEQSNFVEQPFIPITYKQKKRPKSSWAHHKFRRRMSFINPSIHPDYVLAPIEKVVLALIARGRTPREMAEDLNVGGVTISRHRRSILRKLKAKTNADLVRAYVESTNPSTGSRAQTLVETVLPSLVGATVLAPVLIDNDWCALLMRMRSGATKRVWILSDELGEESGWVLID